MKHHKQILTILAIPLILLIVVELVIIGPLRNDNYFIASLVQSRLGQTKCLIVGDSHPASAFRDELAGQCNNLATGGTSTWMIVDLVKSVSKRNPLDTAIISVGPHYFSSYRIENKSDSFKNISEWFTPFPNPLSQNEAVAGFLIKWTKEKLTLTNQEDTHSLDISPKRIDQHAPLKNWPSSKIADEYKKMVKTLVNKGVKVCIIRTPVIDEYAQKLKQRYNENQWNDFIMDLQNAGAFYIPYPQVFNAYPLEWFANPEHLNKKGAKIFAPKLLDMCLSKK